MTPVDAPVVFTPQALAARWGCSVAQVEGLLRRGVVRGFKVGRFWRVTEGAVVEHEMGATG